VVCSRQGRSPAWGFRPWKGHGGNGVARFVVGFALLAAHVEPRARRAGGPDRGASQRSLFSTERQKPCANPCVSSRHSLASHRSGAAVRCAAAVGEQGGCLSSSSTPARQPVPCGCWWCWLRAPRVQHRASFQAQQCPPPRGPGLPHCRRHRCRGHHRVDQRHGRFVHKNQVIIGACYGLSGRTMSELTLPWPLWPSPPPAIPAGPSVAQAASVGFVRQPPDGRFQGAPGARQAVWQFDWSLWLLEQLKSQPLWLGNPSGRL